MKTNEEYAEEVKKLIVDHVEYLLELLINKEDLYEEDEYEDYATRVSEYPPTYCVELSNNTDNGIIESQLYSYIYKENLPIDKKAIAELINLKDYTNEILDLFVDTNYKLVSIEKDKLVFQLSASLF